MTRHLRLPALAGLLLAAALAVPSRAATLAGVTLPDTTVLNGQTLHLNGMGVRSKTILGVHVYVAGLYVPQPAHDAATLLAEPGSKVLVLHFVHAGSKAQVDSEYRDQHEANCKPGCPQAEDADFERLVAAAPPVKSGDTSTVVFTPTGLQVSANGTAIATIDNPDFARRVLAGFIGAHPPNDALRDGLLGKPAS